MAVADRRDLVTRKNSACLRYSFGQEVIKGRPQDANADHYALVSRIAINGIVRCLRTGETISNSGETFLGDSRKAQVSNNRGGS